MIQCRRDKILFDNANIETRSTTRYTHTFSPSALSPVLLWPQAENLSKEATDKQLKTIRFQSYPKV